MTLSWKQVIFRYEIYHHQTNEMHTEGRPFNRYWVLHISGQGVENQQDACYTGITRDAVADSFIPTVCFADL